MSRILAAGAAATPFVALLLGSCQPAPFHPVSIRPIWAYEDGCASATIQGTGFRADSIQVEFDGVPVPVEWPAAEDPETADGIDDQGFKLNIPEVPPHEVGRARVLVIQDGEAREIGSGFSYAVCDPRPRVDYAYLIDSEGNPVDWSPIEGGMQLVVEGCGFSAGTTVEIGGVPANVAERSCSTGLVVDVPPGEAFGTAGVTITNGEGEQNFDWAVDYNCDGPRFEGIDPFGYDATSGGVGYVSGCGFYDDGVVHTRALLDVPDPDGDPFEGTEVDVAVLDPFTLELLFPPYQVGLADLSIVNPDPADSSGMTPLSQVTVPDALAFANPLSVDALAPEQGALEGGYRVDVYGAGFDFLISVDWGGVPLGEGDWLLVDGGHLVVHAAPSGEGPGPVQVTVSHPVAGSASSTFIYLAE